MNKKSILLLVLIFNFSCILTCSFFFNHINEKEMNEKNRDGVLEKKKNINSLNSAGNSFWYTTWGGNSNDFGSGIALDSLGNIYITGYTRSFGVGSEDIFLSKYNSFGQQQWNITFGTENADWGYTLEIDDSDNIFIAGYINKSESSIYSNVFLGKYNTSGFQLWNTTWGDDKDDWATDIALDKAGNIYITGTKDRSENTDSNAFLAMCNSSGSIEWNKTWGGNYTEFGMNVMVNGSNNIYIAGSTMSFGAGNYDIFLAKYNSSGFQQWNSTWGNSLHNGGGALALHNSENIIVGAYTNNTDTRTYDPVIVQYDKQGNQKWNVTWLGDDYDILDDIKTDSSGNIYITGKTESLGARSMDLLFLQYNHSGILEGQKIWGGVFDDVGTRIAINESDDIYIVGATASFGAGGYDALLIKNPMLFSTTDFPISLLNIFSNEEEMPFYTSNLFILIILVGILSLLVTGSTLIIHFWKKGVFTSLTRERKQKITKTILNLGTEYSRLKISEIAKECEESEYVVINAVKEMINDQEINAEYFNKTKSLAFDIQANIEEIDELMDSFKEWEEEGKTKKK